MKKLFLMFMLLTPFAMAYGERNEIIVSPIYGKQKNNNDKNAPVKDVTGSGIKISLEGKGGVDDESILLNITTIWRILFFRKQVC